MPGNMTGFVRRRRRVPHRSQRKGVAAVEMALVLPVLLIIALGTISVGQLIYFRKSMVTAAAEGARLATQRTTTSGDVTQRIAAVLESRRIENAAITINDGAAIETLPPGSLIEIDVDADYDAIGIDVFGLQVAVPVTVSATILRE